VANKIVGPAFEAVAKKYAGRADIVDYLTGKIRKGGQGVWGPIPMPEQAQLNEADAKALAQWIAGAAK
jgi:cytochrome c